MSAILVAISPVLVAVLTSVLKRVTGIHLTESHKGAVRALCAVLSLIMAGLTAATDGTPVDEQVIEVAVFTVLNFLGSTGTWFLAKNAAKPEL